MDMLSKSEMDRVPRTLADCTQPTRTVNSLVRLSKFLEIVGKVLFVILLGLGVILSIVAAINVAELTEDAISALLTLILTLIPWGIGAVVAYWSFHIWVLLTESLLLITHSTSTSANLAVYQAYKASAYDTAPVPEGMWKCWHCGTHNKDQYGQCKTCGQYRMDG